ncbi:hypothetical protein ACKVEX_10615 [Rhodocyclaceae bacterium SMB388]
MNPESTGNAVAERRNDTHKLMRAVSIILARYELHNLKRLYDDFERDILLPLLLGEVALHNIGARERGETLPPNGDAEDWLDCRLKPCNAYSIAAATGLPRETVRRKIARLVELGWLNKRHNGHLYVSSNALEYFGRLLLSRDLPELLETTDKVRRLYADANVDLPCLTR